MARRGNRENPARHPGRLPEPAAAARHLPSSPVHPSLAENSAFFPGPAEACRRLALGGLAFLGVTRAFYPSEDADTGTGLVWLFL